jgi:pimeloyl-ACP methyl ester carboxylesterase
MAPPSETLAATIEVGGIPTWYRVAGEGEPLLLLHGALTDASEFVATEPALAPRFRVYSPERRGHGHTPDVEGPITYDLMADDTVAFLDQVVGGPAHLVGHSDGANVALLVALRRPDLVRRLVLMSGNFHYHGIRPEAVAAVGDLEELDLMADAYGAVSPDGRDHFAVVAGKINRMISEEPTLTEGDLAGVAARTLVMVGDDDAISFDHTLALYLGIPDGELAVVPGTSHVLLLDKPGLCNTILLDFLTHDAVPTLMPLRRREASTPGSRP